MPLQPAALELLAALAPVLARWGRWYVFGAQAVTLYGAPRLSADVDVTLALVPDDPESFAREMGTTGLRSALDGPGFGALSLGCWPTQGFRNDGTHGESVSTQCEHTASRFQSEKPI